MKKVLLNASKDVIFSILGLLLYNGIIQLVVYPYFNNKLGADAFGTALYILSVVSIMGSSFGSGASYSRMVAHSERTEANGDYNRFLLQIFILSVPVSFFTLYLQNEFSISLFIQIFLLMIFTVMRYYLDVQFRMTIRFKEYFLYLVALTVGNVAGLFVFSISGSWSGSVFLGELFAVIFVYFTGNMLRKPYLVVSDSYKENMRSVWVLSVSNLVAAIILNSDRILIKSFVGAEEVTVFYTAALVGKMIAMFTSPLNGVIISYLTGYKIRLTKQKFAFASLIMFVVSIVFIIASVIVSNIFVKIMYPNVYETAKDFFLVANAGQVFYFLSGSLMVIVLKFTGENMQLKINIMHLIIFAILTIPGTIIFGLEGLATGLLISNLFRFVVTILIGIRHCQKS
ncbi:MAG: hypothetical protein K6B41_07300 [Butyrivibrio sp.]|nr:hypothetical protein [Butyrivibrio sp.]